MANRAVAHKELGGLGDTVLLKLVIRFLVCLAVLFGLIAWLGQRTQLIADLALTTTVAAATLMNLSGVVATHAGNVITVPGRQLVI